MPDAPREPTPAKPDRPDEFYVGYLPIPAGHLRFIRIAIPSLLWLMVLIAAGVTLTQRSPGLAVWDQGTPIEKTGILRELPYPHIDDGASATFLVEQGKRGTQQRTKGLDGTHVRITGWKLERDGREILELIPESSAIRATDESREAVAASTPLGPTTLRGEIVDYKCYLGAMKPGDGKSHKACAILCMTGGIPAMLVSHENGQPLYTVLADARGGPIPDTIIQLGGEPVTVSGDLEQRGPIRVLKVQSVTRQ